MKQLISNRIRAIYAITMMWMALVLLVILAALSASALSVLPSLPFFNDHEYNFMVFITFFFLIIISFLSIATFILWFRRAYFNLSQKVSTLKYTNKWAIVSWFIPIVNLYLPYKIVKELFRETEKLLTQNGITVNSNLFRKPLFWLRLSYILTITLLFVFFGMLYLYSQKLFLDYYAYNGCIIIGILLAFTTINIIKKYSKMERLLYKDTQKANIFDIIIGLIFIYYMVNLVCTVFMVVGDMVI